MENNRIDGDIPSENNIGKDKKGWFTKGNKYGSFPRKLTITYLTKLIRKDEKLHPDKKPILIHYKERLYKSDVLLSKFMDKYLPTININELTGAGGSPLTVTTVLAYKEPGKGENGITS